MATHSSVLAWRIPGTGEPGGPSSMLKPLTVDHNKLLTNNKLLTILKEMEISDRFTCILRNLYAGQEAIARTGHGAMDWFRIGEGV